VNHLKTKNNKQPLELDSDFASKEEQEQALEELAIHGVDIASLLWRKVLANSAPNVREMLEAYRLLVSALRAELPHEYPSVRRSHDELFGMIEGAKSYLADEQPKQEGDHV